MMLEEGKRVRSTEIDVGDVEQARWDVLNVRQPWFYLRLAAYGFFGYPRGHGGNTETSA